MIWRSSGLPLRHTRHAARAFFAATQRLQSSSLRSSTLDVATVLGTPATNDQRVVTVAGSIRTVRKQKHLSFVELGDGSTVQSLQAVLEPSQAEGCVLHITPLSSHPELT